MCQINNCNCNLNIWYYMDEEIWNKVVKIYESMEGWLGFNEGIPYWFGHEEDDIFIQASVEPSGLAFYAQMESQKWLSWINRFKVEATNILGFEVGEPEDGYM